MTRRYEVVYIFDSALEEPQIEEHLDRFHALLKNGDNPEPIQNVSHWGKRTLAYAIAGREVGYYVVTRLATDPTLLPEYERLLKLDESVLRYQLVLNEGEVPTPIVPLGDDDDERPRGAKAEAPETTDAPAGEAPAKTEAPETTEAPATEADGKGDEK